MSEPPRDHFTTREGKTIALKAWDFDALSEHAADVKRFVDTWADTAMGEAEGTLDAVRAVLPAVRAGVQDPESLRYVTGLAQQIDLIEAVWDYNELGVGLGKSVKVQAKMRGQILTSIGGKALQADTPSSTGT